MRDNVPSSQKSLRNIRGNKNLRIIAIIVLLAIAIYVYLYVI